VKNPAVIIIKKAHRGGHGGHHGGAWKVAYADFVTAMMAFFLVMWLVAQSNAVKAGIAGYFKEPGIFDYEKSNGPIQGGQMKLDPDNPTPVRVNPADPALEMAGRAALERAAGRLKDALGGLPEFQKLQSQIEIQLTPEGLRIELVEGAGATFFDSGSASLKSETEHILGTIAGELGKLENPVVVEGHTDSQPFSESRSYTNWELSADRANAARRVMERLGLHENQVQAVRGYADRHPRVPEAPFDPRNRRVSIVVQNLSMQAQSVDSGQLPQVIEGGTTRTSAAGEGAHGPSPEPVSAKTAAEEHTTTPGAAGH